MTKEQKIVKELLIRDKKTPKHIPTKGVLLEEERDALIALLKDSEELDAEREERKRLCKDLAEAQKEPETLNKQYDLLYDTYLEAKLKPLITPFRLDILRKKATNWDRIKNISVEKWKGEINNFLDKEGLEIKVWKKEYFGSYPEQKAVKDLALAIKKKINEVGGGR